MLGVGRGVELRQVPEAQHVAQGEVGTSVHSSCHGVVDEGALRGEEWVQIQPRRWCIRAESFMRQR